MWDALTTPASGDAVLSLPIALLGALFALGFLVSVVLANGGERRLASHPVTRRSVRRFAGYGIGVFGAGLFFFAIRLLEINPFGFGMPIWMLLCLLAAAILAIFCVYDLLVRLPSRIARFDQQRLKRQYLQPGVAATKPPTAASLRESARSQPRGSRR